MTLMIKPIPDKAEVAVELVGKTYVETFDQTARFETHLDKTRISLSLHRYDPPAARAAVRLHFGYEAFAAVLRDMAKSTRKLTAGDVAHHDHLRDAAEALYRALGANPGDDLSKLKPQDEVLLLHILE
jgi:hypothetical protein